MYSLTFSTKVTNKNYSFCEKIYYSIKNRIRLVNTIYRSTKIFSLYGWTLIGPAVGGWFDKDANVLYIEPSYQLLIDSENVNDYTITSLAKHLGIILKQDSVLVARHQVQTRFTKNNLNRVVGKQDD